MTSQVFLPVFLLLFLQPNITYALQSNTSFEFDPNDLIGELRRGDNSELVHKLKKHLMYLGYLGPNNLGNENSFDQPLEHAIIKYQEFYKLNITGVVDISTITSLRKPRCGYPDFFNPQAHSKSLYAFYPGNPKWGKTKLWCYIVQTTPDAYRPAIYRALAAWQQVSPFRFPMVKNNFPNIKFSFEVGAHGECEPFYADTWKIAHISKPPGGEDGEVEVHFNGCKRWSPDGDPDALDIETTATHEMGHALGLEHSTVEDAIMFPHIGEGVKKGIHADDIEGIRALYGF
ncbi:Metalloendoprotein 1 precursor [Dorcoceras hygrometricum]|uniref:Metalloendoprotein 1 n=1 Tax=Dorcoceras hygrometricum TaxID=472368 RepID=A0A2Z7BGY8_9LAMI|nr:Metalloendoprotein 1 precursor [Dorcoceras hygrometricum]